VAGAGASEYTDGRQDYTNKGQSCRRLPACAANGKSRDGATSRAPAASPPTQQQQQQQREASSRYYCPATRPPQPERDTWSAI